VELGRTIIKKGFRRVAAEDLSIVLLEAGDRLLPCPSGDLGLRSGQTASHSVEVRLRTPVSAITEAGVDTEYGGLRTGLNIWAAGVASPPFATWLGVEAGPGGRIPVDDGLHVIGCESVFAIGDIAFAAGPDGRPLPALAQVAKQQGRYLGETLRDSRPAQPFVYRHRGDAGVIGRHAAFIDFGRSHFTGVLGWILWAIIHVWLLVGFENRMLVVTQWAWQYFRGRYSARLVSARDAS
jgi:NADH dehydrogenase